MEGQIAILRNRQFSQLDIALLLEELDFFVGKHKRELRGRLRLQMLHLLQCEYQPLLRSTSWISSICIQRNEIDDALEGSPSLRPQLATVAAAQYPRAVAQAAKETGLPISHFPPSLPYTEAQLLDHDFLP
jgi:hypothetical protein